MFTGGTTWILTHGQIHKEDKQQTPPTPTQKKQKNTKKKQSRKQRKRRINKTKTDPKFGARPSFITPRRRASAPWGWRSRLGLGKVLELSRVFFSTSKLVAISRDPEKRKAKKQTNKTKQNVLHFLGKSRKVPFDRVWVEIDARAAGLDWRCAPFARKTIYFAKR